LSSNTADSRIQNQQPHPLYTEPDEREKATLSARDMGLRSNIQDMQTIKVPMSVKHGENKFLNATVNRKKINLEQKAPNRQSEKEVKRIIPKANLYRTGQEQRAKRSQSA